MQFKKYLFSGPLVFSPGGPFSHPTQLPLSQSATPLGPCCAISSASLFLIQVKEAQLFPKLLITPKVK